jgi:hypothetical protein
VRTLANLHAKMCLVDDWVLLGSGNLSAAGLDGLNAELGIATNDPAITEPAGDQVQVWWERAVLLRPEHLKGRRAVRPSRAKKGSGRSGLPAQRVPARPGSALARWKRDHAIIRLRRVLAIGRQPSPNPSPRLPRRRSAAYRACQQLRDEDPRTLELLRQVLERHPVADARVHAAWRLTVRPPAQGIEPTTVRLLIRSYRHDPALAVRRNAHRALARLQRSGHIAIKGRLHEPRSIEENVLVPQVKRLRPTSPAR